MNDWKADWLSLRLKTNVNVSIIGVNTIDKEEQGNIMYL